MPVDAPLMSFNVALGVLLVDILLSGDNAIVIALVCRSMSREHRFKAMWLGVLGAFLARLILTAFATFAMRIPLIKLVGGLLLLKISIDLIVQNAGGGDDADGHPAAHSDIFSAAKTIILADIVMSLDNVIALSAITQNNFQMLVMGLLLSIPILMFGSLYVARMLDVFPRLLWIGGAILGGVSGALIIEDPVFGATFASATSTADMLVPLVAALYVVLQSKIILNNQSLLSGREPPASLLSIFQSPPKVAAQPAPPSAPQPVAAGKQADAAPTARTGTGTGPSLQANAAASVARRAVQPPARTVSARASAKSSQPSTASTRLLLGVGAGVLVVVGLGYYVLTSPLLPSPEGFKTYRCAAPAFEISYLPNATKIRFASASGVVAATVLDGRVVWKDYRAASISLGIPPPNNIVLADSTKMVVNGGMFENTECRASSK